MLSLPLRLVRTVPLYRTNRYFSVFKSFSQKWQEIKNNKELNTIPNMITASRIVSSPFLAIAIALDMKYTALGGCVLFGFTDWLDGYLAKRLNQKTVFGAFLDPLADKFMIGSITVGLAFNGLLPMPLMGVIIGRDLFLTAASFIIRAIEKPKEAAFFDTTVSATFEIAPSDLSKINTAVQFLLLSCTLTQFAFDLPIQAYVEPLWWITATTTLASGVGYLDGSGIKRLKKIVKPL